MYKYGQLVEADNWPNSRKLEGWLEVKTRIGGSSLGRARGPKERSKKRDRGPRGVEEFIIQDKRERTIGIGLRSTESMVDMKGWGI
jgi:hypothetical protein